MKAIELVTNPSLIGYNSSIRGKKEIIDIIFNIIKLINLDKFVASQTPRLTVARDKVLVFVYVDKMSRVFIVAPDKIHSFHFPFSILDNQSRLCCKHNNVEIDNVVLSVLSAVFYDFSESSSVENLLDTLWSFEAEFQLEKELLIAIEKLIVFIIAFESGYLRFDVDEVRSRENHPKSHLDLYYSSNNTFKIGLENKITYHQFLEILDIKKKCWRLNNN